MEKRRLIDINPLRNQVDADFHDVREHERANLCRTSGLSVHLGEYSHFMYLMDKQPTITDPIDTVHDISDQVESLDCNSVNQSYSDGYADAISDVMEILGRSLETLLEESKRESKK